MIKTTLTIGGKDWIAQNLGINNCMTETSRAFTYHDDQNNIDISATGGTATMMNRLIDSLVSYITIGGTRYNASALSAANGSMPVYPADVQWVMANDAGASQYCVGVAPPPSDKPVTGPLTVNILEGKACPPGSPSVVLDTSEAFAYFKADPCMYVGVMEILVQSLSSECFTYYTWEMRMWDGDTGPTCPTTEPEWRQISRFLGEVSDKKVISVKMLGASENVMIGGSFEIPTHFRGVKTICLSLWGDYDKQTLLDDLATSGYAEEIPWASIK